MAAASNAHSSRVANQGDCGMRPVMPENRRSRKRPRSDELALQVAGVLDAAKLGLVEDGIGSGAGLLHVGRGAGLAARAASAVRRWVAESRRVRRLESLVSA